MTGGGWSRFLSASVADSQLGRKFSGFVSRGRKKGVKKQKFVGAEKTQLAVCLCGKCASIVPLCCSVDLYLVTGRDVITGVVCV